MSATSTKPSKLRSYAGGEPASGWSNAQVVILAFMRFALMLVGVAAFAAACSGFLRRANNGNWGVVLALSDPDFCLEELEA